MLFRSGGGTLTLGAASGVPYTINVSGSLGSGVLTLVPTSTFTSSGVLTLVPYGNSTFTLTPVASAMNYTVIPETSAAVLGGLGLLALLHRRRG